MSPGIATRTTQASESRREGLYDLAFAAYSPFALLCSIWLGVQRGGAKIPSV